MGLDRKHSTLQQGNQSRIATQTIPIPQSFIHCYNIKLYLTIPINYHITQFIYHFIRGGIIPIIKGYSRSHSHLVIQQINHHLIPTLSLYITYNSIITPPFIPSHHSSHHIPIHFPKTPLFINPFTPLKPFPLPQTPLSQSHSFPTFPSISLTILETPILPYKSTLFQSAPNPSHHPIISHI